MIATYKNGVNNFVKVTGYVTVYGTDSSGKKTRIFGGPNLVVDAGLVVLTELIGALSPTVNAPTAAYNEIASLYVGGRVTGSVSVLGATPPAAGQTNLQGTLIKRLAIVGGGVTYNNGIKAVDFHTTLANGDGNGFDVQEVGLFTAGTNAVDPDLAAAGSPAPRMFARQVIGTISKTNVLTLDFTWRIAFSAS